jgi:hypothetical protein
MPNLVSAAGGRSATGREKPNQPQVDGYCNKRFTVSQCFQRPTSNGAIGARDPHMRDPSTCGASMRRNGERPKIHDEQQRSHRQTRKDTEIGTFNDALPCVFCVLPWLKKHDAEPRKSTD